MMFGKVLTLNLIASTSIKGFSAKRKIRQKLLSHIRTIGNKGHHHIDIITALDAHQSDLAVWENFEFSNSPKNTRLFKNKGSVENLIQETEDELDQLASVVLSGKKFQRAIKSYFDGLYYHHFNYVPLRKGQDVFITTT